MQTGNELAANLETVKTMSREAAGNGAQLVLTPEYTLMMDGSGRVMRERALDANGDPALPSCRRSRASFRCGCSSARSR